MAVTTNLAVQHHQQDTDYYCGAACAQMVLETIGTGILDQDDLYADNNSHSTAEGGWASGPDGLTWTMNDRRPAAFTNHFVLYALASEDLISRKVCWTIHHYNVAPIALVYGWAHWIVVRGYTTSNHPASSGDNSYTIDAFDINNPWPYSPSWDDPADAPPPPHTAADGCGTGGDRGIVNEHVTYATWQSTYMTGVPGGYWSGQFVAVCDPEPPAERGGPQRPPPKREGRGNILSPKAAGDLAVRGLKEYGLFEREDWRAALDGAEPGTPLLVQRLDRLDSFYYVSPLMQGRRISVLANVDARWGDYQQAAFLPKSRAEHRFITGEEALKLILSRPIDLGRLRGRLHVRKEVVCPCPHLVWRPCRESLSPYYPFYMFVVGDHRLYVRTDGALFTSLTLGEKGI